MKTCNSKLDSKITAGTALAVGAGEMAAHSGNCGAGQSVWILEQRERNMRTGLWEEVGPNMKGLESFAKGLGFILTTMEGHGKTAGVL